jgi:RNA polymerase sigma-70 factor (ECF subfamily)
VSADDAALVRRCLRGESEAVGELVARFQHDVYGLCVRMLGHRHDAEDVTQEVLLRVFRSLRRWDPSRPLKPWVMRIAVNRCRTWLGRRMQRPQLTATLDDWTAGANRADEATELAQGIETALAGLRPDFREVFVLYHQHGQAYEEISEEVGRPIGTVKTWLHRARLALLELLRERGLVQEETEQVGRHAPGERERGRR